ncbi:MAG TPA: hypothetical protein VL098_04240 [Flavipsychrobacter sp.]|nr:hypothetical protein [Flavipsychrobacter sp.]
MIEIVELKSKLFSLEASEWLGLIDSIIFQTYTDKKVDDVHIQLKKIAGETDLIFRLLYNISKDDKTGGASDKFFRAIIDLINGTPLNVRTAAGHEYLIWYLKKIKPLRYRKAIRQIIYSKGDDFHGLNIGTDYTCLQLLLDIYLSIMELNDSEFEKYLFIKSNDTRSPPYFPGYLYLLYIKNSNAVSASDTLKSVISSAMTDEDPKIIYLLRFVTNNDYLDFNWKDFYRALEDTNATSDSFVGAIIINFLQGAIDNLFEENTPNMTTLPLDLCYLYYISDKFFMTSYMETFTKVKRRILFDLQKGSGNMGSNKIIRITDKQKILADFLASKNIASN